MSELDGGRGVIDRSYESDTAKLAMFPLADGGIRFIIRSHPSNEDLAYVDISRVDVLRIIHEDIPQLLKDSESSGRR